MKRRIWKKEDNNEEKKNNDEYGGMEEDMKTENERHVKWIMKSNMQQWQISRQCMKERNMKNENNEGKW